MTRPAAAIGSILFFLLAPGTVAGLVPWWITRWDLTGSSLSSMAVGAAAVIIGLVALAACFSRFAADGSGTPAPVAPTTSSRARRSSTSVRSSTISIS